MAVQPKCPICGLDLMSNDGKDSDGKVVESQFSYWIHNPRDIHGDVLVTAHKDCFDKAKVVYPTFDQPTQADWTAPKYPAVDKNGVVSQKTLTQLLNAKII